MTSAEPIATPTGFSHGAELLATNGAIALRNLAAQIEGLEPDGRHGHQTLEDRVGLIDLILLRGLILGRIVDYERAEEIAEQLVRDDAADGAAFVALPTH
jgi:hypothetical protein